jgi:hypothetical protein
MEDRALADRLVNYADALAAVSFVGMSGLSIAMADPDVRCSITQGALVPVGLINLVSATAVTVVLAILRRWERDLRSGSPLSPKAARISARLHVARFVIVWLSAGAAVAVILASARDTSCVV